MPDMFPLLYPDGKTKIYDPQSNSYQLGKQCLTCNKPITFKNSITPCECHNFAHETCLMEKLSSDNKDGQIWSYKCQQCKTSLKVKYLTQFTIQFCLRTKNIIGFIISFTLFWNFLLNNNIVASKLLGTILASLSLTFSFIFLLNLIVNKKAKLISIISTRLEFMVSAFISMNEENGTNMELNNVM